MYKDSTPSSDKSLKTAVKGYCVENCGWLQLGGHLHTGTVCLSCEDIKKKQQVPKPLGLHQNKLKDMFCLTGPVLETENS